MGTSYEFTCNACKYQIKVSDGQDIGMVAVVKTQMCQACHRVVDVLIGSCGEVGPTGDPEMDGRLNRCPDCKSENLHPWPPTHPCPKCDGKMIQTEGMEIYWD